VVESVEEHHVVAWLLSELSHLSPKEETFDAKVTVLIENGLVAFDGRPQVRLGSVAAAYHQDCYVVVGLFVVQ